MRAAADGQTEIAACLFWTVSCTVIFRPFHSVVALAMSSPIFLGERPRGPTFGAREDVAPTSPPTTRNLMIFRPFHSVVALAMSSPIFLGERPRGPTLGARDAVAPTSPPTHLSLMILISVGSNF